MKKKKKVWKIIRNIFLFLLVLMIIGICVAYVKLKPVYIETKQEVYQTIQDMGKGSFRRDGNTYIYDKDDKVIGKLGSEKYSYVSSDDISDYIKNGYIAQEDRRFAVHSGIDVKAICRAGLSIIKNKGKITQGGSTITQQVVKNNLLSNEVTFHRKLTEAMTAMAMEKTYTKAQIMEFYCNSNYYGCGCYGVEGAAQYYFGKSANDVTLAEAAMLVGVSNLPNVYNPVVSYEKATTKKESVLNSMLSEGYITKEEYDQAMGEDPEIVEKTDNTDKDNYMVSYAVHCATLELMQEQGFELKYSFTGEKEYEAYKDDYKNTYSECSAQIRSGGYKIYTSFDQDVQKELQKAVKKNLKGELNAAAVCVDNSTQMVVAMVGGKNDNDEYNRGFLMERSPGSSIKPLLVYGPALNEGDVTAGTLVEDKEVDFNGYSPKNADGNYLGWMTVREALARSQNTVAVQLLSQTGIKTSMSYLSKLKFSSLCYADTTMLSTALGGFTNGVTVVNMAKGYATIANGGQYVNNSCLRKIIKEDGSMVYQVNDEQTEVYNEDTAYILTDLMQGTFREEFGTAHSLYTDKQYYAGKTGTTNDNKDAWFCGFSSYYTTAVWTGCDTPKSIDDLKGSTYPASIWMSFMDAIHQDKEKQDFVPPETVYLENTAGTERDLEPSDDRYTSRPAGYDYSSRLTEQAIEEQAMKRRLEEQKKAAEEAVSVFEDYDITSTQEATALDSTYQSVLDVIERIEKTSEQVSYKNRAAYKYELLSQEVKEKWNAVLLQEQENAQKKKDIENKRKAAESEEQAIEELENKRKQVVEWYIDALNERTVYGDNTKQMIQDAQTALTACSAYDWYDSLESRLNAAIAYAQSLPTKEQIDQQNNTTILPDDSSYPEDSTYYNW